MTIQNKLTLTVNQRLCLELKRHYNQSQQKAGKTVWPSALIQPLDRWLCQLWSVSSDPRILLSPWQERCLWQDIITCDTDITTLNPNQTAEQALQAWQLQHQWLLSEQSIEQLANEDIEHYLRWARQFKQRCDDQLWLSKAELLNALSNTIKDISKHLPAHIQLQGFDEQVPALKLFLKTITPYTQVTSHKPSSLTQKITRTSFQSSHDELHHIATWALKGIKESKTSAIIMPKLSQAQANIVDIFTDACSLVFPEKTPRSVFNISAAKALKQYDIINIALTILQIKPRLLDIERFSPCLQSPYIAQTDDEIDIAAQIDYRLREHGQKIVAFSEIFNVIKNLPSDHSESWLLRLTQLQHYKQKLPRHATPSEWVAHWMEQLNLIGWPGQRGLNSLEYQCHQRFVLLLSELTEIETIKSTLSQTEALDLLSQQLQKTSFQAEGSEAPIQILGILESAGLQFDQLWFANLDNKQWPPAAKPNPFLPLALQREQGLPHSSPARELQFSEIIQTRLFNSAQQIFLSHHGIDGEQHLDPSPLIESFAEVIHTPRVKEKITCFDLEAFIDEYADTVNDKETIRGGASILKQQAHCPFKAFAHIRLNAHSPRQPQTGVDPQTRGNLVHYVLETLWNRIKDQQTLLAYSPKKLDTVIDAAIKEAMQQTNKSQHTSAHEWFLSIEQQRLKTIIIEWLALEKQRQPFSVIEQEQQHHLTVGKLPMRLQVDRVDRLANGDTVIIDYKTGMTTLNHWHGERLLEPQLPLYCAFTAEDPIQAISYAQLIPGKMQFKGLGTKSEHNSGQGAFISSLKSLSTKDWQQQCHTWQQQLLNLSDAFCQGDATVSPASRQSCQYCDLHALCRIPYE